LNIDQLFYGFLLKEKFVCEARDTRFTPVIRAEIDAEKRVGGVHDPYDTHPALGLAAA
jgi:hypothetical protein